MLAEMTEMSGPLHRLPTINCLSCGMELISAEFEPRSNGGAPNASGYDSCLRRCERCGIGYSNALRAQATRLVRIYRDPFWNLPAFVAEGHDRVLAHALNVVNRTSKKRKFGSINSEDHLTWTVFRALQLWGELDIIRNLAQLPANNDISPRLLLWGCDPNAVCIDSCDLRTYLVGLLDQLGEDISSRSEPDVIIDYGQDGVVFIEVKLRSGNDFRGPAHAGWARYNQSDHCFTDGSDAVNACRSYELVRNWRILDEYAGDRPGVLINLANDHVGLERFQDIINCHHHRQFIKCTWHDLLSRITHRPQWLYNYLADRQVCDLELLENR